MRDNKCRASSVALRHAAAARSNDASFHNLRRKSRESKNIMAAKKKVAKKAVKKTVKKAAKKR